MTRLIWEPAIVAHEREVLTLMRSFYAEERLNFDEEVTVEALRALLADPTIGQVFLLRAEVGAAKGYLVLTLGFSVEFGGRFVLVDEVYVDASVRGQGWGKGSLARAEAWAREQGARVLRLEVQHVNTHARAFYERAGFVKHSRDLLTRWL